MNDYESLNHTKWECKYHVVFIPKYRRKALYGSLRKHLGELFREPARHKECHMRHAFLVFHEDRALGALASTQPALGFQQVDPVLLAPIPRGGEAAISGS